MARIQVEPGYTVEPRYIDIEDDERLCPSCNGTGKTVVAYGRLSNITGTCWTCNGQGKVAFCALCHEPRHIIKRAPNVAWMAKLCLDCIRRQLQAERG